MSDANEAMDRIEEHMEKWCADVARLREMAEKAQGAEAESLSARAEDLRGRIAELLGVLYELEAAKGEERAQAMRACADAWENLDTAMDQARDEFDL
ncbi:MAG: hypothetical protein BWZ10_00643 [candidate division BRC1 bacterium ADurb.BinA364]|nr:MAG: hypothetical protein BWZ10_00643 [candidate division BRC1 bacterium ADurb.BinA364]